MDRGRRGVVVAGSGADPVVAEIAAGAGWPVLGDPMSGARRAAAAVAHYDALLRDAAFVAGHAPDVVLRVGDLPTSKPLRAWLAGLSDAEHIAFEPPSTWSDPDATLARLLRGRLAALPTAEDGWLDAWRAADARVADAFADVLGDDLGEPQVARLLGSALPAGATLVVASSMPVRDLESFAPVRPDPPRVLSNRGANGIDGTVSTAYGVASVSDGPVVLLIGDVALLHDAGGLLAGRRLGLDLDIVLLNNDGGGIFEFLPVAGEGDFFEEHVATPHGVDFAHLAAFYGCAHERADDLAGVTGALGRGGTTHRRGAHRSRGEPRAAPARDGGRAGGDRVRPLASPVRELRAAAVVQAAGCAVAIGLVALLERASVVGAIVLAALGAGIFGVAVWVAAYRRFLADALADPPPDPDGVGREAPRRTLARTLLTTLPLVIVVMGMAILVPGVAGVLLGNAVALALMARGMREWQRREGALLLREPRYRTQGPDGRTGRGFLDPVDFYRADLRR